MSQQPPGQDHFLLISAGQASHRCVLAGGLDVQLPDVFIREFFHLAPAHGTEETLHDLQGQNDVLPYAQVGDDAVPLPVLRQISDSVLHGLMGVGNPYILSPDLHLAAGNPVGAEDGPDTLAASRSQKPRKAVHFALADPEVKGLAGRAGESLRLIHDLALCRGVLVNSFQPFQIVQVLSHHLRHQLQLRQLRHGIFAHQFSVAQHGNPVADLINLFQEVGHKDDAHAAALQIAHQLEQHVHFLVIQGGSGLVQDQNLAVHIHGPSDGHHLLHRQGAAGELLFGPRGDPKILQDFGSFLLIVLPVDYGPLRPANEHILRHRQIRAQGDFLVYGADARVLGILRRMNRGFPFDSLNMNAASVLFIDAGQHFDQGGFSRAVFSHQGMNFSPPQRKIHVIEGSGAGKQLADSPHG